MKYVDYEFIPLDSSEPCEWIFEDSFEEIEDDEFEVFERLEDHFEILCS